jgi:cytochrome oxidase Cu insertion factor (SCO1/SenC/PrrC family)
MGRNETRRRRTAAGVLTIAVAAIACTALGTGGLAAAADSPTAGHPMLGEKAPAFELESVAGEMKSLGDFRGKYLVVHFGASW